MKVEAVCLNNGCPTVRDSVRSRQLLTVERVWIDRAYDEDRNLVECPLCGEAVEVITMVKEDNQIPLGELYVSPKVLDFVDGDVDKALSISDLVDQHARGDHPAPPEEHGAAVGTLYSMFEFQGRLIWIYTNPMRTKTSVTFAWEDYVA